MILAKNTFNKKQSYRNRKGRKFGSDITNICADSQNKENTHEKYQTMEIEEEKPLRNSRNSKSLIRNRSRRATYLEQNEKKFENNIDIEPQRIRTQSIISEEPRNTAPIDDHMADINQYVIQQSFLFRITENYMNWQTEISITMREQIVNWLIYAHLQTKLSQETLFLSVYLLDRYCYLKNIPCHKYQLLGVSSLLIAAKFNEIITPRLSKYVELCQGIMSESIVIQMQADILNTISFQINQVVLPRQLLQLRIEQLFNNPNPNYQLHCIKGNLIQMCQYIMQLSLVQFDFCRMKPNYLSAVIIYVGVKLAQVSNNNEERTNNLGSKKIIQLYQLSEMLFKQYFHIVMELYKNRKDPKFYEVNRKYGINIVQN